MRTPLSLVERPTDAAGSRPGWSAVRRLLVVRLDNLGDVLMTTPAIAALRRGLPQARITLLASASGASAAPHLADIDDAIVAAVPWMKAGEEADDLPLGTAESALVARVAARSFDAAVIFTTCTQSALPAALVCRMAGIPLRLAHCRENPYDLLSDWVKDHDTVGDGMRHEVERQLALVASVGFASDGPAPLRFSVHDADRRAVAVRLHEAGVPESGGYVVVHPGASAASRRYPADRFGIAADRIATRTGRTIVFTGADGERPLVEEARRMMIAPSASLAGELSLGELAALIESADLVVANNSGPAHLAAAVGTPVVDLYALTNPQHTPWQVPTRVLSHPVPCRNCLKSVCPAGHHGCLRGVGPELVVRAAEELLAAGREPGMRLAETGHGHVLDSAVATPLHGHGAVQ